MGLRDYKDVAPTVLAEQHRIVAELHARLPAVLDRALKGE